MQFLPERIVLLKERNMGSYHLSAYYLSKILASLPMRLLLPFLYLVVSYPMVNLNPSVKVFFAVAGTQLLSALCGDSVGICIGTMSTDYRKCLTIGTLSSMLLMLTGGYYASKLPVFLQWVRYISPFKYSYDACVQLVFSIPVPCVNGYVLTECYYNPKGVASTKSVANYLHTTESIGINIAALIIFIIILRIGAYLLLRFIPHNTGRK